MAPNPFSGVARKVVIPLIVLSAVGWVVFVVGLGLERNRYDKTKGEKIEEKSDKHYPQWAAAVVGPVTYIALLTHAALWRQLSSTVGSITAIIFVVYLVAMGGVLCQYGDKVYQFNHPLPHAKKHEDHYLVSIQFAGSLIACSFGACVLAVWPWYSSGAPAHDSSLN